MRHRTPILSVAGLNVALGGKAVLQDINLSAHAGELVAILGPNGAGKSTLMRAISGQISPRRGKVRIAGGNPVSSRQARQAFGLVPQRIALYDKLTARENLMCFGAIMRVPARQARARAAELMEQVGLAHRMNEPVQRLSGGMRRRVNIAAALMHRPALLILDEPTVGLDFEAQMGIVQLLQALKAEGVAILLVTHHLEEAELLADRLAILVKGRIMALGMPAQLLQHVFANLRDIKLVDPRLSQAGASGAHPLRLDNLGLFPDARGREWTGVLPSDDPRLDRLLQAIARDELVAEEVTIRRAGLEMLLARCIAAADQETA